MGAGGRPRLPGDVVHVRGGGGRLRGGLARVPRLPFVRSSSRLWNPQCAWLRGGACAGRRRLLKGRRRLNIIMQDHPYVTGAEAGRDEILKSIFAGSVK